MSPNLNSTNYPESQAAEEAVIGALMINPRALPNVASFLKSEHFFWRQPRAIFAAFERMFESQNYQFHDPILVLNSLQPDINNPLNDQRYALGYLIQLSRNCPTSVHAEIYAQLVYRAWKRRELIRVADTLRVWARDEALSVEEIYTRSEAELFAVTESNSERTPSDMKSIVESGLDGLDERIRMFQGGEMVGIPTCYQALDDLVGGAFRKELIIWGAPAGFGKTTIILNIIRNRCKMGIHQALFSTEMSKEAIFMKFISMETGVSIKRLKSGDVVGADYTRVLEASTRVQNWPVLIIDSFPQLTPLDVQRELRRFTHETVIDSVFIDGLWQMKHHKSEKLYAHNRPGEVTAIVDALRKLAFEFKIPVEVVHQLKRAASERGDKRPIMQDLGESAGTERSADVIIGLYRESYYTRETGDNDAEAIILKNRLGIEYGVATLQFEKESETYRDSLNYIPKAKRVIINTGSHKSQSTTPH